MGCISCCMSFMGQKEECISPYSLILFNDFVNLFPCLIRSCVCISLRQPVLGLDDSLGPLSIKLLLVHKMRTNVYIVWGWAFFLTCCHSLSMGLSSLSFFLKVIFCVCLRLMLSTLFLRSPSSAFHASQTCSNPPRAQHRAIGIVHGEEGR